MIYVVLLWMFRIVVAYTDLDPAGDQLLLFKERHTGRLPVIMAVETLPKYRDLNKTINAGPVGILTIENGAPAEYTDVTNSLNISSLINNDYFMDIMTHLSRERIPERVVHAKGAGAFGYFEVTHDITDICKAELFNTTGKITPVAVRFSSVGADKGGNDLVRDTRGFAVKFYTEEGNFDVVGLNTPIFVIKDPLGFTNFAHCKKRNPATNLYDNNMLWEFITLYPESMFHFLYIFGDYGEPYTYRHMPGYSIHTYQLENSLGETYFARLHFIPKEGIKNLLSEDAMAIGGNDADYYVRDLYNSIGKGDYPTWLVKLQVLTLDDVKKADFDVFDTTRILPEDKYPLRSLGKIVLDRNPLNYFAEVEQIAFCPANVVNGILGAPDKMYEARRLSYRDTQYYRLSANFQRLPVNCPYRSKFYTYNRDGRPTFDNNGVDAPNYYPNTFFGPVPIMGSAKTKLIEITQSKPYNFDQASEHVKSLSDDEKERLIENIVQSLGTVLSFLQDRAIRLISSIDSEVGQKIATKIYVNRTLSDISDDVK